MRQKMSGGLWNAPLSGQGLEDSAERILSDPSQLPKSAEHAVLWDAVALHLGRPELSQKVWDTFDAEDLDEVYRSLHRLSRFQKMLAATQWKEAQQELRSLDQTSYSRLSWPVWKPLKRSSRQNCQGPEPSLPKRLRVVPQF